ncbi:hypothetical protein LTR70_008351 [Exophiala xenobiotica]|nr:hypothetical protein LTR70_008351 [Exophiala xenobiotica]
MSANSYLKDKLVFFHKFEISLSQDQRHFLLQHPDLLSPDMVGALYQASLDRAPHEAVSTKDASPTSFMNKRTQASPRKPRKVVNSWMAFRSYYSPLIKDLPQKARSPMLAMLWKSDVDHGLWELLSAAFSYVRDNHSEDSVSLEQFLGVATQVVPIVPADQYLARTGWTRVGDTLHRAEVSSKEGPKATNVSCAGLARYCFRQGLISKPPMTTQADLKPSRSRDTPPSRISFAAMASAPHTVKAAEQPQSVGLPRQSSSIDDIKLSHTGSTSGVGRIGLENSNASLANNRSSSDGPLATLLSNSAANSPFTATTPSSDAFDLGDTFDSSSFMVDDFWKFSK